MTTPAKRRKRKEPKTLTKAEVQAILGVCNLRSLTGLRDRCMLELMYRAGLRVGELGRLMPRDVTLARCQVRIYDGKGGDGTAYFDDAPAFDGHTTTELLRRWLEVRERQLVRELGRVPEDAPLFCTIRGGNTSKGGPRVAGAAVLPRQIQDMVGGGRAGRASTRAA